MDRRRTVVAHRVHVFGCAVALVTSEAIARVLRVVVDHDLITRVFRQHARRRNTASSRIATDDGERGLRETGHPPGVGKHVPGANGKPANGASHA